MAFSRICHSRAEYDQHRRCREGDQAGWYDSMGRYVSRIKQVFQIFARLCCFNQNLKCWTIDWAISYTRANAARELHVLKHSRQIKGYSTG